MRNICRNSRVSVSESENYLRRTVTVCIRVLFAGLFAANVCPVRAFAHDRGPIQAVATIRHDLPLLLAATLQRTHLNPTIDWVVAGDKDAIAKWHAGQRKGIVALRSRANVWWWRAAAATDSGTITSWTPMTVPGNAMPCADYTLLSGPPSAHDLLVRGFIDHPLFSLLSSRLPINPVAAELKECFPDLRYTVSWSEACDATFFHQAEIGWSWFSLTGHAPTDQHHLPVGTIAYYMFSLRAESFPGKSPPPVVTFSGRSTLRVWFPYVLDPRKGYTLSLGNVNPDLRSVSGVLRNNELTFTLPRFSLAAGMVARGEIDGKD